MPDVRKAVRLRIEGRVQGVGFRAWVVAEATRLGLDGWVANRRDGGVEAVLSGASGSIEVAVRLCRRGPSAARVDMVKVLDEPLVVGPGFQVASTR